MTRRTILKISKNYNAKNLSTNQYTVFDSNIIHLKRVHERSGSLTPVNNLEDIPFSVKRVYYLYDMPGGESRGAHSHRNLEQLVIAASGSFEVMLDDGRNKKNGQPIPALYGPPCKARDVALDLNNFSSGSICLALASELYDQKALYQGPTTSSKAMEEKQSADPSPKPVS